MLGPRRSAIGLALVCIAGCGAADAPPAQPLAALGDGSYRARMTSTLAPGQEIERCQFFVVPDDGLWIAAEATRFSPGSHHVLLFRTPYASAPARDERGHAIDPRAPFDCPEGAVAHARVDGVIGGSQSPSAAPRELPAGVALHLAPRTVLLLDTHYLNATTSTLAVEAAIDLRAVPAATVTAEAGVAFFYDLFIRVPPHGQSTARLRCPVRRDVTLLDAQSHMHRRGVGYLAQLTDADGHPIAPLYQTDRWEDVPVASFRPGKLLPAGTAIDYRCDYASTEDRTILQGFTTRDEMCMFIGTYYPRDPVFETCGTDGSIYTSSLGGTYVGGGTATCDATLACWKSALPGSVDQGASFTGCLVDSCPGAARAVTDFLWKCQSSRGHGACDEPCATDDDRAACMACLVAACPDEVAACHAATCDI